MTPIQTLIQKQRDFFATGATKQLAFRKAQLARLKTLLEDNTQAICDVLKADLNKPADQVMLAEITPLVHEIDYMLENLERLAAPKNVESPETLKLFGAGEYHSQIIAEPYGVTLNISPWNYPFQLSISPIIGAIAAGNTVVLKPSEFTVHSSALLNRLVAQYFAPEFFTVVEGDVAVNQALLAEKFDYIFFTGSVPVGRIVMAAASKHLTPVTLELGGKSPFIVDKSANLEQAADSLIFGKTFNSGQTCIAPDYLLIHEVVKAEFVAILNQKLTALFGDNPWQNYAKVVSERHYLRIKNFLKDGNIVAGGLFNDETHQMIMTVLDGVTWDSPVMQDEIFGSVLPMLTFSRFDDALAQITAQAKPLALYCFTEDKTNQEKVLAQVSFGGGAINSCFLHFFNHNLPFGGVGDSGMGSYHGDRSFYELSHEKAVVVRKIA
ncbi:aldehyde dehydrogenase family protein [Bisgaard Taxon 10/6]|uniref:aldehyde dehydrogenase family protein n=1 Tax=Exercitatus varius TaxID=67857 RepID=UPI00294B361D|nr:aldehyde dehydrogenase family protein [Exercitatus varius]MDG2956101.1 aldehyde dehydrogenase family protein [Exercitatus varius]MDG2962112.1 aldehyde dehydrogenase family protein [Exercitatus varius]MDG2965234.1 aldehyde dehydrogenase family protein [Exercitatus varius]